MKTTKRILSIALSFLMAFSCFSVVPTVATAQANDNLTIIEPILAEGTTKTESGYTWAQKSEKLYAGSSYAGTTLQVDNVYDSTLKALGENNRITKVFGEGSLGGTYNYNLAKVTDGDIFDGNGSNTADYTTVYTFPSRTAAPLGGARFNTDDTDDIYDATITVTLSETTKIDTLYAFAHPGINIAWSTYKIYVGNNPDTLYDDANEVAYFDYYEAYKNQNTVAWSLNGVHSGGAAGARRSEGQIWKFTGEKPIGKYVGYKIYHGETGYPTRIDLYDIGVFGDTAYTIDAGSNSTEKIDAITAKSEFMPFNLKVADITPTYLYTNYADKNLINKIEFIRNGEESYNDAATTAIQSEVSAFDRMTDGKIYDASGTDPYNSSLGWYGQSSSQLGEFYYKGDKLHLDRVAEEGDNFDAKFIMTLKGETTIDSFYFFGHIRAYLTTTTYKVFAGNDKDTLFDADNEVALFDYAKYTDGSFAKLNGGDYSEGQIWTFSDKKPQGKYVGLIVYDAATNASNPKFLEVAELGVTGERIASTNVTTDTYAPVIDSNYDINVQATNITADYLNESRVNGNLLKKASIQAYNNSMTAVGTGNNTTIAGLYDGTMDTEGAFCSNYWYIYNNLTLGAVPEGYATITLESTFEISELALFSAARADYALAAYEIYVSDDKATLYDEENLVSTYQYTGYTYNQTTAGKLNNANNNKNSEGQIYTFTGVEKPEGQFIGIKILDGSANPDLGWLYFSEIYIDGIKTGTVTSDTFLPAVKSNYEVNLKGADITADYFTEEKVNGNLLKKEGASFAAYNNAKGKLNSNFATALPLITDGIIDTTGAWATNASGANSFWYVNNQFTEGADPEGYITFTLDNTYTLTELYLMSGYKAPAALAGYNVYVGTDEATLYDPENLVLNYNYDGYTDNQNLSTTGKINTVNSNKNAEGQIYTFTGEKKPEAKYVGIEVLNGAAGYTGWVYLCEVGIFGFDKNYTFDTSSFNDETSIEVLNEDTAEIGKPLSFKVNVKNGGTATKVVANDVELTPVDGVYTIDALANSTVFQVETDRDEFATTKGMWNGLNLNLGSASYGTNIWDDDVTIHETVMFWSTRESAKLLYPIENIISIRSYDFKETYWVGEDFEIVDGKLKLTDNSRMTVYETENATVEYADNGNWQNIQWKYQVRVTYTHSDVWEDTTYDVAPEGKLQEVVKFHEKAMSGEDTTVLFLGDSISVGCNSSGLYQPTYGFYDADGDGKLDFDLPASELREKYQFYYNCFGLSKVPEWGNNSWAYQVTEALKTKYNNDNITMVNRAVGSTASAWGSKKENLDFFLDGVNPDLVFIGYGMNESKNDPSVINANISVIIDYIREINPNCSIVLVSAFVPNYNQADVDNKLDIQEAGYQELVEKYDNLVVAPVNSVFHSVINAKDPADYTGNNYNHPNDFGASIYASTILATLSGEVNPVKVEFTDNSNNVVYTVEGFGSITLTEKDYADAVAKLPSIFGYEFVAWNNEVAETEEDVILKAIYQKTTKDKYTVRATDGEEIYEGFHNFDARITAVASGEGFSFWKDNANGSALSDKKTYIFYVPGDIDIETVYGEENAVKPVTLNSAVQKILRADGKYNLYFTGEINAPEGAELTSFGIAYTNAEASIENLETTETDMTKGVAVKAYTEKLKNGPAMVILSGVKAAQQRYAKLFITYTLNGETYTVFTDCTATGSTAE